MVNIIWKVYELVKYPSDKSLWAIFSGDLTIMGTESVPEYHLHESFLSEKASATSAVWNNIFVFHIQ